MLSIIFGKMTCFLVNRYNFVAALTSRNHVGQRVSGGDLCHKAETTPEPTDEIAAREPRCGVRITQQISLLLPHTFGEKKGLTESEGPIG